MKENGISYIWKRIAIIVAVSMGVILAIFSTKKLWNQMSNNTLGKSEVYEIRIIKDGMGEVYAKDSSNKKTYKEKNGIIQVPVGVEVELVFNASSTYHITSLQIDGNNIDNAVKQQSYREILFYDQICESIEIKFSTYSEFNLECEGKAKIKFNGVEYADASELKNLNIMENACIDLYVQPDEFYEIVSIQQNDKVYKDQTLNQILDEEGGYHFYSENVLGKTDITVKIEKKKYYINYKINQGGILKVDDQIIEEVSEENKSIVEGRLQVEVGSNHTIQVETLNPYYYITKIVTMGEIKYEEDLYDKQSEKIIVDNISNDINIEIKFERIKKSNYMQLEMVYREDVLGMYVESQNAYIFKNHEENEVEFTEQRNNFIVKYMITDKNEFLDANIKLNNTVRLVGFIVASKDNTMVYECRKEVNIIYDDCKPYVQNYVLKFIGANDYKLDIEAYDSGGAGVEHIYIADKENYKLWLNNRNTEIKKVSGINDKYTILLNYNEFDKNKAYYIWAVDFADNRSELFPIDLTPPTITASTESTWSNSQVKIQGTCQDKDSGVSSVYYSLNKSDFDSHLEDTLSNASKGVKKAKFDTKSETFTITIDNTKSNQSICYIWAYDSVGNRTVSPCEVEFKVDTESPTVSLIEKIPNTKWTNQAVAMKVKVVDEGKIASGIKEIYYSIDKNGTNAVYIDLQYLENDIFTIVTPKIEDKPVPWSGTYYIWGKDYANNISEPLKVAINIDTEAPEVTAVQMYHSVNGKQEEIEKSTSHGIYTNSEVKLYCIVKDNGYSSGIKDVTLLCDGKRMETKKADANGEVCYTIKAPFDGKLSFEVTDNVGNTSKEILLHQINGGLKSSKLMIENGIPTIKLTLPNAEYIDKKERKWYKKRVAFTTQFQDDKSGISSVEVKINGIVQKYDMQGNKIQTEFSNKIVLDKAFEFDTSSIEAKEDGSYEIEVQVSDYAGNKRSMKEVIFIDAKKPLISQISFNGEEDGLESTGYQYFYTEAPKIVIEALDEGASSGIRDITYYTVDYGVNEQGVKSKETTITVNKDQKIEVTLGKKFKGYIYARATDNVGNTTAAFAQSKGTIIENQQEHNHTARVEIKLPNTEKTDAKGNPLYAAEVPVTIEVEDTYAGIASFSWSVMGEKDTQKNQSGFIHIDDAGKVKEQQGEGAIQEKKENLVTKLSNTVYVKHNCNEIVVKASMKDRIGDVTEKYMILTIDKTAPQIVIAFDKTQEKNPYYNQERKATITVMERNFNPKLVEIVLDKNYGGEPKVSPWIEKKNSDNPEQTTYQATVLYQEDGEYSLSVHVKDEAGNKGESKSTESFIIDRTKPEITVELLNKDVANTNYYKAEQQALITIREKNFTKESLQVKGIAKREGKEVSYPQIGEMKSEGDIHRILITYSEDGEYSLQVKVKDQAQNQSENSKEFYFTVDRNAPLVQVSGIVNNTAYNSPVVPVIEFTDTNINVKECRIVFTGAKRGELDLTGQTQELATGRRMVFDCFPETEEMDDFYTMKVMTEDYAGNKTAKEYNFSINRFGSVYSLDSELLAMSESYVNQEQDVVIRETNVNGLSPESIQIKVIKNGIPANLVNGIDYSVGILESTDHWAQYEYIIHKDVFCEEGKYSIAIYSEDEAGNINENIEESKCAEIWFGIDKTPPVITALNFSGGKTYGQESKQLALAISDNLVMQDVKIYLNDQEIDYTVENEIYQFVMPCSNSSQNVNVIARDAAGNTYERTFSDMYVTTNLVIRFLHNQTLLICSFSSIMAVLIGAIWIIRRRKRAS